MDIIGRISWSGPGWYASRIEGDSGKEVVMPLETAGREEMAFYAGRGVLGELRKINGI